MSIFNKPIKNEKLNHITDIYLPNITNIKQKVLFFDIETTGFSPKTSICYLIGCVFYSKDSWQYIQWFSESPEDEICLINSFNNFVKDYDYLIHFNGDNFDIPFLIERAKLLGIDDFEPSIKGLKNIDLFKDCKYLKKFIQLNNYKQKTIEDFLGISRADTSNGGELIKVYKAYITIDNNSPKKEIFRDLLLLHNHDDICDLPHLLMLLSYHEVLNGTFNIISASTDIKSKSEESDNYKLNIKGRLNYPVPVPINIDSRPYEISINSNSIEFIIHFQKDTLKHFYKDYKNYYYIQDEDMAIHKSVAEYVDKSRRIAASRYNCYVKKNDLFIPQPTAVITPDFKNEVKENSSFFIYKDAFIQDKALLYDYCKSIIDSIFK